MVTGAMEDGAGTAIGATRREAAGLATDIDGAAAVGAVAVVRCGSWVSALNVETYQRRRPGRVLDRLRSF